RPSSRTSRPSPPCPGSWPTGPTRSAIGSKASPGTILVSIRTPSGAGVAEVPIGTTLRDILGLAGRAAAIADLKAILVGGPAGGILPADLADTPYEFHALRAVGAHAGS